jgi:hypothetical protein
MNGDITAKTPNDMMSDCNCVQTFLHVKGKLLLIVPRANLCAF